MSIEAMTVVLHHSRAKGTDKLVLLGIANHSGDGGAWPAVATLARYANTTERNVQRSIGKLVGLGELARYVQQGGTLTSHAHDYERPNRYDVLLSCPPWCDRTMHHRVLKGWQSLGDGSYGPKLEPLLPAPTEAEAEAQLEGLEDPATLELLEAERVAEHEAETAEGLAEAERRRTAATPAPAETVAEIRRRLRGGDS